MFEKLKLSPADASQHLSELIFHCEVVEISAELTLDAIRVSTQYQYSFYDSLIIATALQENCEILYSEDLQHRQVIDGKLSIINPFL